MSFSSDELNYLIYRYMVENGFSHSSFTFGKEAQVARTADKLQKTFPPAGMLVMLVQKGMQYLELEANDVEDMEGDYCPLTPQEMLTKTTDQLKETVREHKDRHRRGYREERREERAAREDKGGDQMVAPQDVHILEGHGSEVFICAWSPKESLLASGSGDSTSRIWNLGEPGRPALVLLHGLQADQKPKDVTTLDWNADGSMLGTGSYDGLARVWSKDGNLIHTLEQHKGPIFSLKWNKTRDYLLSGSVDKTAVVWDGRNGKMIQQFEFHTAPTLDVDWRDQNCFATCSTDRKIVVWELGNKSPRSVLLGHTDEVNAVKWDPSGTLLASCSDDHTAKVWKPDDSNQPVLNLTEHVKEIYNIKWSPTGPGSANPNRSLMLASACFDHTGRIWSIPTGQQLLALTKHTQPLYSVAFSPSGQLIATGSFDKFVHIWDTHNGSLVKSYKGSGGIFEVCWNRTGDQVAACFSSKTVVVLDLRA
eukprot:jgi/Botrbrau1/360/Bobra.110_2s0018.1